MIDIGTPTQIVNQSAFMQQRRSVKKLFTYFKVRSAILDNRAFLIVYNESYPEKSYILSEQL